MFEGKNIIVTGASSGIGRAIAIYLSSHGAKCILVGRSRERLLETRDVCLTETIVFDRDLTEVRDFESLISEIVSQSGPIYGLVHSAGVENTTLLPQIKRQEIDQMFDINVFSAMQMLSVLTKKKYREDIQSHVLISSVMGVVGNKGLATYSATKGAVISMVRSMALELASKKIRINAISPGHIADSGMTSAMEQKLSQEALQKIEENHPLGLGTCDDVAKVVKFLLSQDSRWITGQNIVVDGGYTIQ